LCEKLPDELLLFFVFDSSEELGPEFLDCLGPIKGQARVNFAAIEVTGLASGFKDGFDLSSEVDA